MHLAVIVEAIKNLSEDIFLLCDLYRRVIILVYGGVAVENKSYKMLCRACVADGGFGSINEFPVSVFVRAEFYCAYGVTVCSGKSIK